MTIVHSWRIKACDCHVNKDSDANAKLQFACACQALVVLHYVNARMHRLTRSIARRAIMVHALILRVRKKCI